MNSINRRAEARIEVRMPIRVRPITDPPSPEQSAESVNISEHGLFFSTSYLLRVGEEVEIHLRMPRELAEHSIQVRWKARVVHVETDGVTGRNGVGVRAEAQAPIAERACWIC